jgi:hypothetical protein
VTVEQREANLVLAQEQILVARTLMTATERLLRNAELALGHAAERADVYGDALAAIRTSLEDAKRTHDAAMLRLVRLEKTVDGLVKERLEA